MPYRETLPGECAEERFAPVRGCLGEICSYERVLRRAFLLREGAEEKLSPWRILCCGEKG
jgi:hypothetical protein